MFPLDNVGALVRQGPGGFIPRIVAAAGSVDTNIPIKRARLSVADATLAAVLGSVAFWLIPALQVPWPPTAKIELWLADLCPKGYLFDSEAGTGSPRRIAAPDRQ